MSTPHHLLRLAGVISALTCAFAANAGSISYSSNAGQLAVPVSDCTNFGFSGKGNTGNVLVCADTQTGGTPASCSGLSGVLASTPSAAPSNFVSVVPGDAIVLGATCSNATTYNLLGTSVDGTSPGAQRILQSGALSSFRLPISRNATPGDTLYNLYVTAHNDQNTADSAAGGNAQLTYKIVSAPATPPSCSISGPASGNIGSSQSFTAVDGTSAATGCQATSGVTLAVYSGSTTGSTPLQTGGASVSYSFPNAGSYTIGLHACNGNACTDKTAAYTAVDPNAGVTALTSCSINAPSSATQGATVNLSLTCQPANAPTTAFSWYSGASGTALSTSPVGSQAGYSFVMGSADVYLKAHVANSVSNVDTAVIKVAYSGGNTPALADCPGYTGKTIRGTETLDSYHQELYANLNSSQIIEFELNPSVTSLGGASTYSHRFDLSESGGAAPANRYVTIATKSCAMNYGDPSIIEQSGGQLVGLGITIGAQENLTDPTNPILGAGKKYYMIVRSGGYLDAGGNWQISAPSRITLSTLITWN